jgi:hypothetical protein
MRGDERDWTGRPGRAIVVRSGAEWWKVMYDEPMSRTDKPVRQSVTLPSPVARRVKTLAKNQRTSTNRVLVELIESGLDSKEAEKLRFFELADKLGSVSDERERVKKELAKLTFGE